MSEVINVFSTSPIKLVPLPTIDVTNKLKQCDIVIVDIIASLHSSQTCPTEEC